MPAVWWRSQRGTFGPDNASLSARYPTLLIAAGYAFAVWGPVFLLGLALAVWQLGSSPEFDRLRRPTSLCAHQHVDERVPSALAAATWRRAR